MTISIKQKALLHVAKTKLGLSDESYRAVLAHIAGVTSSTELDQAGFEAIMGMFEYSGFRPLQATGPNYGSRPGMASFAQIELIRALWSEYCDFKEWKGDDRADLEKGLGTWMTTYFKISSLRFVTAAQAPKMITALKAMKANKRKAA